jgi:hypothetical protein
MPVDEMTLENFTMMGWRFMLVFIPGQASALLSYIDSRRK